MQLTWKEFKDKVEKEGVEDSEKIDYIDITGYDEIHVTFDYEHNEFSIWT